MNQPFGSNVLGWISTPTNEELAIKIAYLESRLAVLESKIIHEDQFIPKETKPEKHTPVEKPSMFAFGQSSPDPVPFGSQPAFGDRSYVSKRET